MFLGATPFSNSLVVKKSEERKKGDVVAKAPPPVPIAPSRDSNSNTKGPKKNDTFNKAEAQRTRKENSHLHTSFNQN